MAGNLEDKIKYGLREYDGYASIESGGRAGTKQKWYYKGKLFMLERGSPGYYYKKPHQILREFKELIDIAFPYDSGAREAPPPTPLEKYEGTIYVEPKHYEDAKREYEHEPEERSVMPGKEGALGGLAVLMGVLVIIWYFLFGNMRKG